MWHVRCLMDAVLTCNAICCDTIPRITLEGCGFQGFTRKAPTHPACWCKWRRASQLDAQSIPRFSIGSPITRFGFRTLFWNLRLGARRVFGLWNIILYYIYIIWLLLLLLRWILFVLGSWLAGGGVNAGSCLDPKITHGHGPLLPFACNLTITITITWIFIQLHSSPYSFWVFWVQHSHC